MKKILVCLKKVYRKIKYYQYKYMSEEKYAKELGKIFYKRCHYKLNLEQPVTFNEKIQWLKLYDSSPLKTRLADKVEVRNWVREVIGEKYLIPLIGVWERFEDIDFSKLPRKFVLKTNHGSGYIILVPDKDLLDYKNVKKKVKRWMKENFAFSYGFELHYKNIKPKILIEEYIESLDHSLYDYKIHCFNGKPELIQVIGERDLKEHTAREMFFDTDWNALECTYTYPQPSPEGQRKMFKPKQLKEMLAVSEKLSADFKYVRVDLYLLDNGNIKFGEMTFTAASGFDHWRPEEYDRKWGGVIKLNLDRES